MKWISKILALVFMLTLWTGVSEAASAETIDNGPELARVKRLAIAYPDYYKTLEKEPEMNDFINMLYEAAKVSRSYIISYDEMAAKIQQDTGIDIRVLPKMDARKIFKEHVYKYADAYMVATLANNSRISLFFDIYAVNTNEHIYSVQVQGGKSDETKNVKTYKTMAEECYRNFDKAAQSEAKKKKDE